MPSPTADRRPAVCFAIIFALIAATAGAQEWTRFRGPNGSGIGGGDPPARWTDADLDWNARIPGAGQSSPVAWGEKVFLTSAEDRGARRLVLCLRLEDGGIEWCRAFPSESHPLNPRNSFATSTPAVDADRVYCVFAAPDSLLVVAIGHDGGEVWRRDLGPFRSQHGHGASPILAGDLVVVPDEQDGESCVFALDARTGSARWRAPRRTVEAAYGTPCLHEEGGRLAILLSSHAHGLSAIDAATGEAMWEAPVFDKRTVSSPILAGGLAVGACGSGGGGNFIVAVRPGAPGAGGGPALAWKIARAAPYVPTAVAAGDLIFLWSDIGVVTCAELPEGKVVWQERVEGSFSGSPVWAGGRLYAISEEGEVVVLAAGRKFAVLGRNPLAEGSRATPAVVRGRLLLRSLSHLAAVGGKFAGPGGRRRRV